MTGVIFIGDELTATGFRLTGVESVTPPAEEAAARFAASLERASLVLITAELASRIPHEMLNAALLADQPTVAIIPDVLARVEPPCLARQMKSILGIES